LEAATPGRVKRRKVPRKDEPDDFAKKALTRELYHMIENGKKLYFQLFFVIVITND
jgi:hypothetical protein